MPQEKTPPLSRAEMSRRLLKLDYQYRSEVSEKIRSRWEEGRFTMADMVKLTGRSQEYLIKIEAKGKIPKAEHVTKKRLYQWTEEQARAIIAHVEAHAIGVV